MDFEIDYRTMLIQIHQCLYHSLIIFFNYLNVLMYLYVSLYNTVTCFIYIHMYNSHAQLMNKYQGRHKMTTYNHCFYMYYHNYLIICTNRFYQIKYHLNVSPWFHPSVILYDVSIFPNPGHLSRHKTVHTYSFLAIHIIN